MLFADVDFGGAKIFCRAFLRGSGKSMVLIS